MTETDDNGERRRNINRKHSDLNDTQPPPSSEEEQDEAVIVSEVDKDTDEQQHDTRQLVKMGLSAATDDEKKAYNFVNVVKYVGWKQLAARKETPKSTMDIWGSNTRPVLQQSIPQALTGLPD
ncbi:hypothetical protein CHS0354_030813 [Potamilus streckersoni]|uniref:Uncharacterized protein n=1 Tax=Potamilus streckersoni TaxID=2493646 RepID=A0AAE0WBQ5_9BIVA|nr:hypothetical protein CHS0354_030813 [Potamilus streckersoni]